MRTIFILLSISASTLGIGLLAPTMKTEPRLAIYQGDYTQVMTFLFPEDFTSATYSIVEGIQLMWDQGSEGLAALIFAFSVVFPILKLLILWIASTNLTKENTPGRALSIVEKLGKFSMIDVFVIALLIITIKGLPGGSQIHPEWGLYAFGTSVILSMAAGLLITKKARVLATP